MNGWQKNIPNKNQGNTEKNYNSIRFFANFCGTFWKRV